MPGLDGKPRTHPDLKCVSVNVGAVRVTGGIHIERRVGARRAAGPDGKVWTLRAAALFALCWSVFRAARQSVTLDEADTYLWFGGGQSAKYIFYGFPNNHVLNSLLIWLTTHAFGVSPLTIRIPALLGAALYVSVCVLLARAIAGHFALQFATLLCLVYNPFVLDYFAAARGYSLATAFLMAALAVPLWPARASIARRAAIASAAIGFSFCANFSFAFVDAAAMLVLVVWAIRRRGGESPARVLLCCAFPALIVSAAIGGYPILHYERQALWYGARSWAEMVHSLTEDSLYKLVDPLAAKASVGPALLLALGILAGVRLILGCFDSAFRRSRAAKLAAGLSVIIVLTVAAHHLAFRLWNLPLPLSRTAIYFIPLLTVLAAAIAGAPAGSRVSRWLGNAIAGLLLCVSVHYLLSLRHTYFKEYDKNAEMKEVYRVIDRLSRRYGVQEFTSDGAYTSPLNFYRAIAASKSFPPLPGYPGMVPPGKPAYILHGWFHGPFIEAHRLAILYRGPISQVVVAVPRDGAIPPVPVAP